MTSPSTRWRSRLPDARARRPVRRRRRPRDRTAADPAHPGGVVHRRPAADAARRRASSRGSASSRTPSWCAAVEALGDRLDIVSVERIRDELSKLLRGAGPVGGPLVPRVDAPRRPLPPRAQPDGARAGPDPPPQGRARAHDRGRGQDEPRPRAAPRRADARRRQAEDPLLRARSRDVPPPRGRGRTDDAGSAHRVAVPDRGRGRR